MRGPGVPENLDALLDEPIDTFVSRTFLKVPSAETVSSAARKMQMLGSTEAVVGSSRSADWDSYRAGHPL